MGKKYGVVRLSNKKIMSIHDSISEAEAGRKHLSFITFIAEVEFSEFHDGWVVKAGDA